MVIFTQEFNLSLPPSVLDPYAYTLLEGRDISVTFA